MRKNFLVFGSPLIRQAEIDEVVASLKSGWLGTGQKVQHFEDRFKAYQGARHAIALNSCTAALHLAALALDIQQGDEVIVPAMTFASTANAVIHAGARPVFADCDRRTMNLDPEDLAHRVTGRTKAVIPVHFAGRACRMDRIMAIARTHGLAVIEDCAHAIETAYHGRKAGAFGDMGCFSFYVTKNVITGEGGMLVTGDPDHAKKIKILALHGMSHDAWQRFNDDGYRHYQVVYSGFKYNMTDLQAALGIHQLERVEENWQRRRDIWDYYMKQLEDLPVILPAPVEPDTRHAYHLFTLLIDIDRLSISRDRFLAEMTRRNIGVGVHYTALHLHPFYQKAYGYQRGDFPHAEWISDRTVSIPLSPKLSDEDVDDVVRSVKDILN
jgi:dTDP-4-amino-4,6-dideoxygalactose transaminase